MKSFEISPEFKADLRKIDRDTALHILTRYAETGAGDVKTLHGEPGVLRLRIGDWRVRLKHREESIALLGVAHRSEAYR